MAGGSLVHIAEHVESDDHHCTTQGHEAVGGTEERPVASEEVAEERAFGDDEEKASNSGNDMTCSIEKEELHVVSHL